MKAKIKKTDEIKLYLKKTLFKKKIQKNNLTTELLKIDKTITFNGDITPENSLYTVLNVCFSNDVCNSMLLFSLDLFGIACSGGSACSSGSSKLSHVISEISQNQNQVVVRFSFCKYNTLKEIDYVVEKLRYLLD